MAVKKVEYEVAATDKFTQTFDKLKAQVKSTGDGFTGLQGKLLAFGVGGLTVGAFGLLIKGSIDATARMKDLAQEAGTTASAISRFDAPARMAGLGLDSVAGAMFKLSKAALEAKDPASRAAQALNAIGISTEQLKGLKPDQMFELVARSMAGYSDGLEKNAVMQELLGKSGREMNRVMAEVADSSKLTATVTDEQAEAADRLGDQMVELQMNSEKLWRSLAAEAVPAINDIVRAFIDARKEGSLLDGVFAAISTTWEKLKGTPAEQLATLAKTIALAEESLRERGSTAYDYNALLEKRARLEKIIFDQELAAQDKRATAGSSGKATIKFDPAAEAARVSAAKKMEADALRAAEKALNDYTKAAMDALEMDEKLAKEIADLDKKRTDAVLATEKTIEQITFETSLIGLSNVEREKAIALRNLETAGITQQSQGYAGLSERLLTAIELQHQVIAQQEALRAQSKMWDDIGSAAGNFFADLALNGRSAFDNLRQSLKSFAADIIAFFAKRWVLQMVAGASGTFGATAANAATSALGGMGNSLIGAGLSAASSALFGTAAVTQSVGMGAITTQAATSGLLGSGGAGAALMSALPYVAIAGIVAIAYKKFFDEGDAIRTGSFGAAGTIANEGLNYTGGLGTFGIGSTQWFGADQRTQIDAFLAGMKSLDDGLAKYLNADELKRTGDALNSAKQYAFGLEHTDGSATFGQIMVDHINAVFEAIDPSLEKFLDGFSGTGEELAVFATDLLGVRQALAEGIVPGMTIESLIKAQLAGETLGQTMFRVVSAFQEARDAAVAMFAGIQQQIAQVYGGQWGVQFAQQAFDSIATAWNAAGGWSTTAAQTLADLRAGLNAQGLLDISNPESPSYNATLAGMVGPLLSAFTALQGAIAAQTNATTTNTGGLTDFGGAINTYENDLANARGSLAEYLRGTLLSGNSPLDPMAQYAEARKQYQDMLALAQGGNIDAIAGFGGTRDAFLAASRAVNASSGQYNTDFFSSFNAGAALTNGAVRPYTAADATSNTQTLVAELKASRDTQASTTQAVAALAAVVIEIAQTGDPVLRAKAQEQIEVLNKIASRGGVLAGNGL